LNGFKSHPARQFQPKNFMPRDGDEDRRCTSISSLSNQSIESA
jgi:hypothetical protein